MELELAKLAQKVRFASVSVFVCVCLLLRRRLPPVLTLRPFNFALPPCCCPLPPTLPLCALPACLCLRAALLAAPACPSAPPVFLFVRSPSFQRVSLRFLSPLSRTAIATHNGLTALCEGEGTLTHLWSSVDPHCHLPCHVTVL